MKNSMMKRVHQIEKDFGSLERYAVLLTNLDSFHMMRMEEAYASFRPHMSKVYQDLSELELADLWDFQSLKVGKCDGEFF